MAYIKRDIEEKILSLSKEYSCILITGPRQVGKTTVLLQLMDDFRAYVTLDDLDERSLAKHDPTMFLQIHSTPIIIGEVQYAAELFSCIKMEIDKGSAPDTCWLTGSQAFKFMELAQASLAGRVAILHMSSLSQHEICSSGKCIPFTLELGALKERKKTNAPADIAEIYDRIWKGTTPGLASGKFSDRDVFYSSYLQTCIDRDVKKQVRLADPLLFRDSVRAAACRAG